MSENVIDQIVARLRQSAPELYPQHTELRNVRVVGHTPKTDHYIYDVVVDFPAGSERVAAKVYRPAKCGAQGARNRAHSETQNLQRVYKVFEKKGLTGVPRPLGDFSDAGAVVAEKVSGLPLQSIIMKAALLPGYADHATLGMAAHRAGEWLRQYHKATAEPTAMFDVDRLLSDVERLCVNCKGEGLDDAAIRTITGGAHSILARAKKNLPSSAVLNEFTPLNVIVTSGGIGFCDFAKMSDRGMSLHDAATFLACVEALEKYPFCDRSITARVQQEFTAGYGVSPAEQAILRVLKMKILLSMFAQGRTVKESAQRKKVMWATVMKRFIQQAANRSMSPAA